MSEGSSDSSRQAKGRLRQSSVALQLKGTRLRQDHSDSEVRINEGAYPPTGLHTRHELGVAPMEGQHIRMGNRGLSETHGGTRTDADSSIFPSSTPTLM